MANSEHSTLTGASLHESKGVAAASANRVYVADGVGSGAWSTISNSVLASTAKAFQAQLLHVQDQKSSGTEGGTFTASATIWRTRTLNTTLTNEITSATLVSNQISLPAGTYYLEASATAHKVNTNKLKLRNITAGSDILIGMVVYADASSSDSVAHVSGRFTLAGTTTLELQHICETTRSTNGFGGVGLGFGVVEVFADLKIWKVA